jgi:spore coat protein H
VNAKIVLLAVFFVRTVFAADANGKSVTASQPQVPILSLAAKQKIGSVNSVPVEVRLEGEQGGEKGAVVRSGTARFHGASSQGYPKKSYKLALDKAVAWLGVAERANWVLNAAFIDPSLMRHKLSYDLFRSLSRPGAPRFAASSGFVEVNVNGRYQGAYLLMERVDRALLALKRYDSNATDHACIYKAVDHAAFKSAGHDGFEQHEPDPLVKAFWKPLDQLNRFVLGAKDSEFFDVEKGIGAKLDLGNTIDFHLLILVTSNMDGFDKNLILARDAPSAENPKPRFFFVPWDYDATFGQAWHGGRFPPSAWLSNRLFDRLLTDRSYRKRFAARWTELRKSEFALTTINRMIDENVRVLGAAADRNEARWKGRQSVAENVAGMKSWLERHLKWLDQEIARRTE